MALPDDRGQTVSPTPSQRGRHQPTAIHCRPAATERSSLSHSRVGITTTIRGVATELPVGQANGLDHDSVVNLDDVQTVRRADLGPFLGYLDAQQEPALHQALIRAFDPDD